MDFKRYKKTDCGKWGKASEAKLKGLVGLAEVVSKQNEPDMRKDYKLYEIKTGAGVLGNKGDRLVKNCSKVIYIPVVRDELTVDEQEGFVLSREDFLEVLEECGLIRDKVSTDGVEQKTIQTFWNHSKNAPSSKKKYYELLDALYAHCEMMLDEWLAIYAK